MQMQHCTVAAYNIVLLPLHSTLVLYIVQNKGAVKGNRGIGADPQGRGLQPWLYTASPTGFCYANSGSPVWWAVLPNITFDRVKMFRS